jgi:hypothetical protein
MTDRQMIAALQAALKSNTHMDFDGNMQLRASLLTLIAALEAV